MNESGVPLEMLLQALPQNISSLAIDSRAVTPGALFFALRGEHTDGHRYIDEAVKRGAIAVVSEKAVALPENVTAIVVPDSALALSRIADAFYGSPSRELAVAGVTGTNGKTTTTKMVAAVVKPTSPPASRKIAPAPRNPIPCTRLEAMRVGDESPYIFANWNERMVNSAEPRQTNALVRIPAGRR